MLGFLTINQIIISFFFFKLFGVYKKPLPCSTINENSKVNKVMNLHTSINLAVLHIIRVVVLESRA